MQFFRICSIILLKRQNHDDYAPKCNSPNENNSDQYVTNKVSNIFWYSNSDTQFCLHKSNIYQNQSGGQWYNLY